MIVNNSCTDISIRKATPLSKLFIVSAGKNSAMANIPTNRTTQATVNC
ncbi:hypothetical protein [Alkalihalobacillus sp. 1P02AB]